MKKVLTGQKDLKHVLIIHPEGNSFNNPSLKCIIDFLLENNFKIDLVYKASCAAIPSLKNIRLIAYNKIINYIKCFFLDRLCNWKLAYLLINFERVFFYRKKYDLIIGVDRQGLIEASILNMLISSPYIFISFEIMFESETSALYKLLEQKASKYVALWIAQDELRANQLMLENHLEPENKFLLPLGSKGLGYFNSVRLRDCLGIPLNKKVAIVIGSISSWAMTYQILNVARDWPEDWVLVVHERYGRTSQILKNKFKQFDELGNQKVFISDAAAELIDDMGTILAGVSVGLAFYKPDYNDPNAGKNLKYLGLASGKISTYLRYGMPVIFNDIGFYSEEVKRFQFGCVVEDPSKIKDKLEEVNNDLYQNNARSYFSQRLDFNNYKHYLLDKIHSILL